MSHMTVVCARKGMFLATELGITLQVNIGLSFQHVLENDNSGICTRMPERVNSAPS